MIHEHIKDRLQLVFRNKTLCAVKLIFLAKIAYTHFDAHKNSFSEGVKFSIICAKTSIFGAQKFLCKELFAFSGQNNVKN